MKAAPPARNATTPNARYCATCSADTIIGSNGCCSFCDAPLNGKPAPKHLVSGSRYSSPVNKNIKGRPPSCECGTCANCRRRVASRAHYEANRATIREKRRLSRIRNIDHYRAVDRARNRQRSDRNRPLAPA